MYYRNEYFYNKLDIGNYTEVKNSTVIDSTVGENTTVGPYAYLRPKSNIGNHVKIGDFVEVKNATIEDNLKSITPFIYRRCSCW